MTSQEMKTKYGNVDIKWLKKNATFIGHEGSGQDTDRYFEVPEGAICCLHDEPWQYLAAGTYEFHAPLAHDHSGQIIRAKRIA